MLAAVHLDRVETCVTCLAGDGGSVGTVAGALGDEAGAERVSAEFGECGGVISGAFGAAADGLVDRGPGQRGCTEIAILGDGAE
ncbi:hypothetical protein RhoFasGS6_04402 [Rhodococcus fascians]|nr:hypothetical protein [Rhodococcus fascians]